MRPADIEVLAVPGRPALRGDLLLAAVSRPDLETDQYRSAIRRIALSGGESPWTQGPRDSSPAISPDGRWVAFLRAGEGKGAEGSPQVHVMPVDGGESRKLTSLHLGADAPVWAPDSRWLAFTAREAEPGRYGTEDADERTPEPAAEAPRLITRLDYRIDNVGFLRDRPKRLFVLDTFEAGEPEAVTPRDYSVSLPVWTPDGERVVVIVPHDFDRTETREHDLVAFPVDGGDPEVLAVCAGYADQPVYGADGTLYFFGTSHEDGVVVASNAGLYAVVPDGKPRRLTDVETVDVEPGSGPALPLGDEVLVAVRNRGAVELRAIPTDADGAKLGDLRVLHAGHSAVHGFAADGDTVVAVVADLDTAGELVVLGSDGPRVLTDYSKPLRDKGLCEVVELETTAPDGYPVHGWLVLPDGEGPHPVLRVVHGGPFAQQEWTVFDEAQVYASAGFAVVLGNPRGSAGYGQSHGTSVVHNMGTVDVDDVLALLDKALERPDLDASRTGIMGGSYGGFMTSWVAAKHPDRFRAAWSERAVNAWDSFAGSSDIGYYFTEGYVGADPDEQRRRSPLSYAADVRIPFAVVHSEQDWRCPLEQAQRQFVALRQAGVETEFLLFPGEGHELTRSGKPRHRVQRFEAVLDWWSRQLS
ncbi:S9 family peptidase [Amycolatopsis rubida]|uniref:S9 family peptidase n=1 Tax=Amycolatopsis rubida TaxID=112413 RepID=A0ABX0BTF4_9PSEU|nr:MULTISPECIES: S9 family peptidase [Amycolatopsis]MYW91627.1 alpha/beta fold hydrolase [Amycolatopsis rubida]NEC56612.1 S9 family peptidase [Amycolatopsis rubida]OAP25574.1 Prolyl tripeptidyl peptidase precursor [Amycolatopsis sp. M39]